MEDRLNYITPEEAERLRAYYSQSIITSQQPEVHPHYAARPIVTSHPHGYPVRYTIQQPALYPPQNPNLYPPQHPHMYPPPQGLYTSPVNHSSPTLNQVPNPDINQLNAISNVQSHPPQLKTFQSDYHQHHNRLQNPHYQGQEIMDIEEQEAINNGGQEVYNEIEPSSSTQAIENNDEFPGLKQELKPEDVALPPNVTPAKYELPVHPAMVSMPEDLKEADTFWEKLTVKHRHASRGKKPSLIRFGLRIFQLMASIMCLILNIVAITFINPSVPEFPATFNFYYFLCVLDILVGIFHIVDYYQKRFSYRPKLPKIVNISLDLVLSIFWICSTLALAFQFNPCPINGLDSWCDKRNSLLSFSVMAAAASLTHIIWDLVGTVLNRN